MGLDVYLYRVDNFERMKQQTGEYSRLSEARWNETTKKVGGWEKLTDAQQEQLRRMDRELAASLGLGEEGRYPRNEGIELNSQLHPDHMFKVGYFRSSYNDGGINAVARARGLPGLYDIFGEPNEYNFRPNWEECLVRAENALRDWKKAEADPTASYQVMEEAFNSFREPELIDKTTSLELTVNEISHQKSFETWKSSEGTFSKNGFQVVGVRLGLVKSWNGRDVPGVHIVYKTEENMITWYRESIEIVVETIRYVLEHQGEGEEYYLAWSS